MSASQSGGTSRKLIHGVVSRINFGGTYVGNPNTINNQATLTVDNTTQGCSQPGDSGGTIVDSNHFFIGVVSGAAVSADGKTCFIGFDQAYNSMVGMNLVLGPQPPV